MNPSNNYIMLVFIITAIFSFFTALNLIYEAGVLIHKMWIEKFHKKKIVIEGYTFMEEKRMLIN